MTHHARMKFGVPIATVDVDAPVVPLEEMPGIISLFEKCPKLPAFLLVAHGIRGSRQERGGCGECGRDGRGNRPNRLAAGTWKESFLEP